MRNNISKLLALFIACVMLTVGILALTAYAEEPDTMYVTEINTRIAAANGNIFTSAFNGTNTIKSSEGNFRWTSVVVAEPTDTTGIYRVVSVQDHLTNGEGGTQDIAVTFPQGGFIYAAHFDDSSEGSDTYINSQKNKAKAHALEAGQLLTLSGVNISAGTKTADAVIIIGEAQVEQPSDDESSEVEVSPDESSEEPGNESSEVTTSPDEDSSVAANESSVDTTKGGDEENNTTLLIIIIAAGVLAIAAIVYVIVKKKKS